METSVIVINRPQKYIHMFAKLWIFIDGEKTAYVKNGGSVTLDVDPGNHEIFVSMDYLKSNRLELMLSPGETVHLECGSTLRGMKFFLCFFIILAAYLFKSIKVFYVKQVKNSS